MKRITIEIDDWMLNEIYDTLYYHRKAIGYGTYYGTDEEDLEMRNEYAKVLNQLKPDQHIDYETELK